MKKDIIIEIAGVYLTDFDTQLVAPQYTEDIETGIIVMFPDMDGLNSYHTSLQSDTDAEGDGHKEVVKDKIIGGLKKVLYHNQIVHDEIRNQADLLVEFIFNSEAHRQDKLMILDTMIADIKEANDSWELQKAIRDATFELGEITENPKSNFYEYASNENEYYFDKIKDKLIQELTDLRTGWLS